MHGGPRSDDDVPAFWHALGLPGLADIHVHFLPQRMLEKVWGVFDTAEQHYGQPWPIHYRTGEAQRVAALRDLGVRGIPSLCYAHKPGMARWLNDWCTDFARRTPGAVHSGTFFAEPSCGDDVRDALDAGARLFKLHVEVGDFAPDDPVLGPAWGLLADAGVPVVLHAGSAPRPGAHTGPGPVREVLRRHPGLVLVIAHMGMPEYADFADVARRHEGVHLDTTMVGTDFMEQIAPAPADYLPQLADLGHKIVLGSDFPNIPYPYAHQLEALVRWDLGDEWLQAVLWHNGARLMGLST